MSKTVMRVMMIGLVAMLGAEEHPVNPVTRTEEPALHSEEVEYRRIVSRKRG